MGAQAGLGGLIINLSGNPVFDSVKIGGNVPVQGAYCWVGMNWLTEAGWHAFEDETKIQNTGGHGYASFDAMPTQQGAGPYNHLVGFQSRPIYNSAGALTNYLAAFDSFPVHNGVGVIAAAFGLRINDIGGIGPITVDYGIYIPDIWRGGTNWAIYSQGPSECFFGGAIKTPLVAVNTADGADNGYLGISGGGAAATTRGGLINLFGNEHALKGAVAVLCGLGDGATFGDFILYGAGGPTEFLRYSCVRQVLSFTVLPPAFGGNAAAQAGGLSVGDVYRVAGDPSYLAVRSV